MPLREIPNSNLQLPTPENWGNLEIPRLKHEGIGKTSGSKHQTLEKLQAPDRKTAIRTRPAPEKPLDAGARAVRQAWRVEVWNNSGAWGLGFGVFAVVVSSMDWLSCCYAHFQGILDPLAAKVWRNEPRRARDSAEEPETLESRRMRNSPCYVLTK